MPLPIIWPIIAGLLVIVGIVVALVKWLKKHPFYWILLGNAKSGKTEFLCMLRDVAADPKLELSPHHADVSTAGSNIEKTIYLPELNQKICVSDGAGACNTKQIRIEAVIKSMKSEPKRKVLPCLVINLEQYCENAEDTINYAVAEIEHYCQKLKESEVDEKKLVKKMLIVATHLDKVGNDSPEFRNNFYSKLKDTWKHNEGYSLIPIFGDIYSKEGRLHFLEDLYNKIQLSQ